MVARVSKENRERILYSECRIGEKQPWWDWRVVVCPKQEEAQQDSM